MKKKLTGRLAAAALSVLLCMGACVTAFAESEPITIKECDNLEITLPDNMSAVTRSSEADDMYFKRNNLDYNTVMRDFEAGNIYLQATDNNVSAITLTLSCLENENSQKIKSFSNFSSAELADTAANYISSSSGDTTYNASTQDEAGKDIVWIYFNMTANGHTQYQATTVQNGKSYSLTLYRNGSDVTYSDYYTLQSVVETVKIPAPKAAENNIIAFIKENTLMLCCAGAALIVLIIIIVVLVRKAKRRKKRSNNDKIIEELAGKYTTRQGGDRSEYIDSRYDEPDETAAEEQTYAYPQESVQEEVFDEESYADDFDDDDDVIDRKYSDADIARLLGDVEDDENFTDTLPATQADSEEIAEVRDSVIDEADTISEFFEDEPTDNEETTAPVAEETAESAYFEAFAEEIGADVSADNPAAEEEPTQDEQAEEPEEVTDAQAEKEAAEEADDGDDEAYSEDEEYEEYANDEVLVREESNQNKFKDSSDFFEEAPKKIMGVISSREIEEAEEYDVIGEEEHRAEEIEQETGGSRAAFSDNAKRVGESLKSFGVHCGYFATNVKRSVKRRRAVKKRQQAEAARRQRQAENRQRERGRDSSGLVQVRRRDEGSQNGRK